LKLEETAKGVRISVHVYTNDKQTAINEEIATYLETKQKCVRRKRYKSHQWRKVSDKK